MAMGTCTAIDIIEGIVEADNDELVEAWQAIIDSGATNRLQGSYQRTAERLIRAGLCHWRGE